MFLSTINIAVVAAGINSKPCGPKFLKFLTSCTWWLACKLHLVAPGRNMALVMLFLMIVASTFAVCGTGIAFLSFSASTGFFMAWYQRKLLPKRFGPPPCQLRPSAERVLRRDRPPEAPEAMLEVEADVVRGEHESGTRPRQTRSL